MLGYEMNQWRHQMNMKHLVTNWNAITAHGGEALKKY
jgi:hypothetical protein